MVQGRRSGCLIHRSYCRHRVAHVAHFVDSQGMFVLVYWHDAVGLRQVSAGEHGQHARQGCGLTRIDRAGTGVGMGATEHHAVQHPG